MHLNDVTEIVIIIKDMDTTIIDLTRGPNKKIDFILLSQKQNNTI